MKPPSLLELLAEAMRGTKKIVTYGEKGEPTRKVVDELNRVHDSVFLRRSIQCHRPVEYIKFSINVVEGENGPTEQDEEQGPGGADE